MRENIISKLITNFEIFEGKRKNQSRSDWSEYRGFREKQKNALDKNKKSNDFIPGYYIVFGYADQAIVFGRIVKTRIYHNKEERMTGFISTNLAENLELYLIIRVMDYIEEETMNYMWIGIDKDKEFNSKLVKTILLTSSLKEAEEKYKEAAEEAIIKRDAKKYNL